MSEIAVENEVEDEWNPKNFPNGGGLAVVCLPPDEKERLEELNEFQLMGVHPVVQLDPITALGQRLLNMDFVNMNLVGSTKQWMVSTSAPFPERETPRDGFCHLVTWKSKPLIVPDAHKDWRYKNHLYVKTLRVIGCYLGIPMITKKGHCIGAICAMSKGPRQFTEGEIQTMQELAHMAVQAIYLRNATMKKVQVSMKQEVISNDLQSEKRRLLACLTNFPRGVFMWNLKSNSVVFCNNSFEKLTGYSKDEIYNQKGTPIHFWLPNEASVEVRFLMTESFGPHTKDSNFEFEAVKRDGSKYWASIQISPVLDSNDNISACFGTLTDVTERTKYQMELAKNRDEAQQAVIVKNAFLANMSHEIKTPLDAICASASALVSCKDQTKEQEEMAKMISNSSHNLSILVDDILDFSKLESEHLQLRYSSFHLRTLIEEVIGKFYSSQLGLKVPIFYEISREVPDTVCMDRFRLSQILQKLVSNSVNFTEKGDILISVSLGEKTEKKNEIFKVSNQLKISVKDTGIGMKKETEEWIFQSFWQVDQTRTRKHGGTGLGLAICKRLAVTMGGDISFESVYGLGTTLTFTVSDINPLSIPRSLSPASSFGDLPSVCGYDLVQSIYSDLTQKLGPKKGKRRMSAVQSPITVISSGSEALMLTSMLRHLNMPFVQKESLSVDENYYSNGLVILGINNRSQFPTLNAPILRLTTNSIESPANSRESPGYLAFPITLKSLEQAIDETIDRYILRPPVKRQHPD